VCQSFVTTSSHNGSCGPFKQGDVVSHTSFGRGLILEQWGNDCEVCEVRFEDKVRSVNRCRLSLVESAPEVHPFAEKFPKLSSADYQTLKESIRAHGQFEPVVLNDRGQILDGRHRWQDLPGTWDNAQDDLL
jgi:hypothetical protein